MSSFPRSLTGGVRRYAEEPAAAAQAAVPPEAAFPYFSSAEPIPLHRVKMNGVSFEFWSYEQLEPLGTNILWKRIQILTEGLQNAGFGSQNQPRSRHSEDLIRFILVKQVHVSLASKQIPATALNIAKALRSFGAPEQMVKAELAVPTQNVLAAAPSSSSSSTDKARSPRQSRTSDSYVDGAYGLDVQEVENRKYGHFEDTRYRDGFARCLHGGSKKHVDPPHTEDPPGTISPRSPAALGGAGRPSQREASPSNKKADQALRSASHFNGCVLEKDAPENLIAARFLETDQNPGFGGKTTSYEQRKRYHAPRPSAGVVMGDMVIGDRVSQKSHRTGEDMTWDSPWDDRVVGPHKKRLGADGREEKNWMKDHADCVGVYDNGKHKNDTMVGAGHGRKHIDAVFGVGGGTERGSLATNFKSMRR
ncbi:unnamed protein product [Amoebophrya sp. A25]|nr:unnamed protein product [Amoebophrya sp. A25]|eukprot:GSA25T00021517001.1